MRQVVHDPGEKLWVAAILNAGHWLARFVRSLVGHLNIFSELAYQTS